MKKSLCGLDCEACELTNTCAGCAQTGGRPFGGTCMAAQCCHARGQESCGPCAGACALREELISEFNALGIEDMEEITFLNALLGSYINSEYGFPGGQRARLWDDRRIYLGNQVSKAGSDRCYGIAADERYLMVSEYGAGGADAEIVVFKRRSRKR